MYGDPKAQKRHRTGRGFNYDPSAPDKADFLGIVQHNAPTTPLDKPLSVQISYYFQRPKSHFGTGRNEGKLKSSAPENHIGKPDLDNLAKFVLDALNKVYWRDDSVIVRLTVDKSYCDRPRTEIIINET